MEYTSNYKNVLVIGTSHIAKRSIENIKESFDIYAPDIVCVELDRKRLQALLSGQKPNYSLSGIRDYGLQGYLFAVIGSFIQKKLGNVVGIKPGSDMLTAVNLARQNNKQLMLIDQDIEVTLRRFSKSFSWKEKFRMVYDILMAPFSKKIKINLHDVPKAEIVNVLMEQMKTRYPSIYKTLIVERNQVMAKNIYKIMSENPDKKILVVIGAGHEQGLLDLVKMEHHRRDRIY
jgi:pheromone shutdown-related protein TraB